MVEFTDLMFYNVGATPILPIGANDTLVQAQVWFLKSNEFPEETKADGAHPLNMAQHGSKYRSFCPPLEKLYLEAGGKSFPD